MQRPQRCNRNNHCGKSRAEEKGNKKSLRKFQESPNPHPRRAKIQTSAERLPLLQENAPATARVRKKLAPRNRSEQPTTQNPAGTSCAGSQASLSQRGEGETNTQTGSRKVLRRPLLRKSNLEPAAKGKNVVCRGPPPVLPSRGKKGWP